MATFNVSLGESLSAADGVQAARLGNLAPAQYDIMAGFRFKYPDDLFNVNKQIAQAIKDIAYWTLVDNSYINAQKDLMVLQAARLAVKAAGISATAVVELTGGHPTNGGVSPSSWKVVEAFTLWNTAGGLGVEDTHGPFSVTSQDDLTTFAEGVDYDLVDDLTTSVLTWIGVGTPVLKVHYGGEPVTVYSHTVNWDSDALLTEWEDSWIQLGYAPSVGARYNIYWGSNRNIDAFNLALAALNDLKTIINGREQAAGDLGIRKYINWDTVSPINTRQTSVTVTTVDERKFFVLDVDYTFTVDEIDSTLFNLEALTDEDDVPLMPATVRVRA